MASDKLIEYKVGTSQGNKWFRWTIEHTGEIFTEQGNNFIYLPNRLNASDVRKFKNSALAMYYESYPNNRMNILFFIYSDKPFSITRWYSTNGSSYTSQSTSNFNTRYPGGYYSSNGFSLVTIGSGRCQNLPCIDVYNSAKGWNTFELVGTPLLKYDYLNNYSPNIIFKDYVASTTSWETITNIVGKGKTQILSKINSANVNYGNPVSNGSSSAFDVFTDDSKIDNMISIALSETKDYSKIVVNYKIPTNNYEYIKLVYKKDSIPDSYSEEGAIAVDITADSTSEEIPFVSDGDTYYFVIFTNSSMSEPIKFKSKRKWNGEEIAIMYRGENNKLTVQVTNDQIIFKMYTGETEIYSWVSSIGTTVDDVENIYVQFVTDDDSNVGKPSFVYYNGSTYSYNQEEPTDAQMQAIYTWLEG